jgi:predicted transcriptional regulator
MLAKGNLNGKLVRTAGSPVMPIIVNDANDRRGPEEIKAELLSLALSPVLKNTTMSLCNLSFSQREKYTKILIGKGLLSVGDKNGKQTFETTARGKIWLEQFRRLRAIENGADLSDTAYVS